MYETSKDTYTHIEAQRILKDKTGLGIDSEQLDLKKLEKETTKRLKTV